MRAGTAIRIAFQAVLKIALRWGFALGFMFRMAMDGFHSLSQARKNPRIFGGCLKDAMLRKPEAAI